MLLESEVWFVLLRPDENRTGYHSGLIQLFRGLFFQGTWQPKCWLFENSQKASRAAQNVLTGMWPTGRVFEAPALVCEIFVLSKNTP